MIQFCIFYSILPLQQFKNGEFKKCINRLNHDIRILKRQNMRKNTFGKFSRNVESYIDGNYEIVEPCFLMHKTTDFISISNLSFLHWMKLFLHTIYQ